MWRKALAALVVLVACIALYRFVWTPFHCNYVRGRVTRLTADAWKDAGSFRSREMAMSNAVAISDCLARCKTDYALQMLAGSNFELIGRNEAAVAMYEEALRNNPRPEIYLALGIMQTKMGQRDAALKNFIRAGEFSGTSILLDIPDGALRWEAYRVVGARLDVAAAAMHQPRRNNIANARFESGADRWQPINGATATIESSQRRPSGRTLHVVANRADGGVQQIWPSANATPRVMTSAWVFVRRGRVYLGSGNGHVPLANATSTTTGKWERLEGVNETCPASMTILAAATADGADFLIDEVSATKTFAAPPCE
ncbi:MAG TPA: tetratricopeptide repeat protein [Thermoanaerobaculia bacterium]|nr:tetratricopeptide repeat protein [Thermoanaerobaculia bacterium]